MTTITILPEEKKFRAVSGNRESFGRTAGEALDALTAQLDEEEGGTLVVIQNRRADKFFNSSQQNRLTELMAKRKTKSLLADEEAELEGAKRRAEEMLGGLKP